MEWPARQLALLAVIFRLQRPGGVNEPPLQATRAGLRDLRGVISAQGCTTLAAPAPRPSLPHLSAIIATRSPYRDWHAAGMACQLFWKQPPSSHTESDRPRQSRQSQQLSWSPQIQRSLLTENLQPRLPAQECPGRAKLVCTSLARDFVVWVQRLAGERAGLASAAQGISSGWALGVDTPTPPLPGL